MYASLLLVLLGATACRTAEPEPTAVPLRGGPHAFAAADMASPVPSLSSPLTFEASQSAESAFVAYYDDEGRLATLETLRRGETQSMQRYTYDPAGRLRRRDTIAKDGSLRGEVVGVDGTLRPVVTPAR